MQCQFIVARSATMEVKFDTCVNETENSVRIPGHSNGVFLFCGATKRMVIGL